MLDKLKLNIELDKAGIKQEDALSLLSKGWKIERLDGSKPPLYSGTIQDNTLPLIGFQGDGIRYTNSPREDEALGIHTKINEKFMQIEFSPAKNILKTNFRTPSLQECKHYIEAQSHHMGFDLYEATPQRVDLATNFVMAESPEVYYWFLGGQSGWKYSPYGTGRKTQTVEWTNRQSQTKLMYNKIDWAVDTSQPIPRGYVNSNVLRYEYRCTSNIQISRVTNVQRPILADVLDEQYYLKLVDAYKQQYADIPKINNIQTRMTGAKTPKDLEDIALSLLIEQKGEQIIEVLAKMNFKGDKNEYKHRTRFRSRMRKILEAKRRKETYIEELNSKINEYEPR